jgi:CO/xanthine dehydrogenase FAD-binding subunit
MEGMSAFAVERPKSVAEVAALLASARSARLLAGGTGLLPNLRRGIERPPLLVDLGAVRDFARIAVTDEGLQLGAGVTLARLAADSRVDPRYRALAEAVPSTDPLTAAWPRWAAISVWTPAACSTTRANGGARPTTTA